ncbi:phosphoribosylformylglycinamidine synthase subunit PurS [Alterisphingorhabdus coralli]|uniref:Phosphoribosylformylglycinamidine synthase subunit PurS n=1 Tax=Alterisphingorhabdus coralli TaxID=3071408 RepID=A0AA97I0Y2_9SPHN|nr:phosphoribosylformylglycinamidine synthase subunit PurS [Parasphingorhabdus sp. SCSIO 66989]WOE74225.1 phosphoribosylformylglycinamidine synthase subunit PurS [Parasphingorhabdus sp. SCSIO 66989]
MKIRVHVTLKPGVLDPQGRATHHTLENMGFDGIEDVRCGRMIDLEVAPTVTDEQICDMCRKLLANTVIENFEIVRLDAETEAA